MPKAPDYQGRTPEEIISQKIYFDSVGYIYRALSWLDYAKRNNNNVCAFQYAAHDTRQGIEQLLFEEIVLCVGTDLDRAEYEKCTGNSTKLHKIIKRLNPDYVKMTEFCQAIVPFAHSTINLVKWDHNQLMKNWGKVSKYLHWAGEPAETFDSADWINKGISEVNTAAQYIWNKKQEGYTGIMMPMDMIPEIKDCWERFLKEEIDINAVKRIAFIAQPILNKHFQSFLANRTNFSI